MNRSSASATSAFGALPDPAFEPGERVIVLLGDARLSGTLVGLIGDRAKVVMDARADRPLVADCSVAWLKRETA